MKVILGASTGAKIDVWRENDLFLARRSDHCEEPQICWAVDLFEVIAELARLDLDDRTQGTEAIGLAERAGRALGAV
jgi:hypothetical protein